MPCCTYVFLYIRFLSQSPRRKDATVITFFSKNQISHNLTCILHLSILITCFFNSYIMNQRKISKTKRLYSTKSLFVSFIFSICSIYIYMWKKYSSVVFYEVYSLTVEDDQIPKLNNRNNIHSPKATIAYGKI